MVPAASTSAPEAEPNWPSLLPPEPMMRTGTGGGSAAPTTEEPSSRSVAATRTSPTTGRLGIAGGYRPRRRAWAAGRRCAGRSAGFGPEGPSSPGSTGVADRSGAGVLSQSPAAELASRGPGRRFAHATSSRATTSAASTSGPRHDRSGTPSRRRSASSSDAAAPPPARCQRTRTTPSPETASVEVRAMLTSADAPLAGRQAKDPHYSTTCRLIKQTRTRAKG